MGIFSDTYEDSTEFYGQFRDQNLKGFIRVIHSPFTQRKPLSQCPICFEVLDDKQLNEHLIHKHARSHLYLKVNGQILSTDAYIYEAPKEFELHSIGLENIQVRIQIGDRSIGKEYSTGVSSLLSLLDQNTQGEVKIFLEAPGVPKKEFVLFVGSQPYFKGEIIDKAGYKFLFKPLNERKSPDYNHFREYYKPTNMLEIKYQEGLYDYAVAMENFIQGIEAKTLLERSFANLQPFVTPFAISIKNALAFRMNIFNYLSKLGPMSKFYPSSVFFFNTKEKLHKIGAEEIAERESGVYIDDFANGYNDAICGYYRNDWRYCSEKAHELEKYLIDGDDNNREKINLLNA